MEQEQVEVSRRIIICPRCGSPASWISREKRGNREYVYYVHVYREGKRRRIKKHYAGPADGYVYVERLYGAGLTNIVDVDVAAVVENLVRVFIERFSRDNPEHIEKLVRLAKTLRTLTEEVNRVASEIQSEGSRPGNA